jgi:hypothetical protein
MALIDIADIFNSATDSTVFRRFQAACLIAAKDIRGELDTTVRHADRLAWANAILQAEPQGSFGRVYAHLRYAIATNSAFQTSGVNVLDGDIQFIINSQVDLLL